MTNRKTLLNSFSDIILKRKSINKEKLDESVAVKATEKDEKESILGRLMTILKTND